MRKIREVLRLKFDAGLSVRKIAASLRISSGSAGNYLHRFNACGLSWPTLLSDAEL
ncbi:sigma-70 family RNA polymerase sigma factor, partial [Mycobacterium tuberculosis]|nr:sigma-70 family RNA polymerase sigma factor [Mycobacterium tuberculosis]